MTLCFLDHLTVLFAVEQRRDLAGQFSCGLFLFRAVSDQVGKLSELCGRLVVADLDIVELHVDDQNDLLPHIVEGDHLVEQHQVNILERLAVLDLTSHARFAVAEIIVGKVADKAAGEGRKMHKPRALVGRQDLAQIGGGIVGSELYVACLHHAADTGDLHLRIEAEEGVASPAVVCLCGLEHITVGGYRFEDAHRFDRGGKVREQFTAQRTNIIAARRGDLSDLF